MNHALRGGPVVRLRHRLHELSGFRDLPLVEQAQQPLGQGPQLGLNRLIALLALAVFPHLP